MSRIVGLGFIACDAIAAFLSLINTSGALIVVVFSLLTSLLLGVTSVLVRNTFWPNYFWDPTETCDR